MTLPDFIRRFPSLDLPLRDEVVTTHVLRSEAGLAAFFTFHRDAVIPAHAHKGQWGTVIAGEVELTIDGQPRIYRPGESYDIPAGVVHAVRVKAGTVALDVFEEPDRYPLR